MEIILRSVYDSSPVSGGARYLIETKWPENIHDLSPYRWVKELAPSFFLNELAERSHWSPVTFQHAYWTELECPEAQQAIYQLFEEHDSGVVTFLYAAPFPQKSAAYSLKKFIDMYGCPVPKVVQLPLALAA